VGQSDASRGAGGQLLAWDDPGVEQAMEHAKARGVKIGRKPKLTSQQKREAIKRRDVGNETCREIAASYNVSASTISRLTI
jgi:hypothetical protein